MTHRSDAEEHLRIIRSLMEKATIYRAISAPGALVGGILAIALAAVVVSRGNQTIPFVGVWLALLALVSAVNTGLLWRDARRRGEAFVSPGMKLALRAMGPGLVAGGLCTFIEGGPVLTANLWVLCYGLSLLAAGHFAPKSIQWLGRAFFVAGAGLVLTTAWQPDPFPSLSPFSLACLIMGLTFGVFHLIYAACILACSRTVETRTL